MRPRTSLSSLIILVFLMGHFLSGCAQRVTGGVFPDVSLIDMQLKRGTSKEADVERGLGKPNGHGGAVLPLDHRHHDVWMYDKIDLQVIGSGGKESMIDAGQQILLILFDKGVYDGHMWYKMFTVGEIR